MAHSCINTVIVLFVFLSSFHSSCSFNCEIGRETSALDSLNVFNIKKCPSIVDSNDKEYCCVDDGTVYCCNSVQFFMNGFGTWLPVLIGVVAVFFIVCCVCCLCCPCCLLYKRRHRGTVYGNMLQPGVQTVVATSQPVQQSTPAPVYVPQPMPGYPQTQAYPMYQPQAGQQQPPPYSESTTQEAYSKQAAYNPNY